MSVVRDLSQCLRDIGGPNDDVENDIDEFLLGFREPSNVVKVEEQSSTVDQLHSSLLTNDSSSLQANIMHSSIVHSLTVVCWNELDQAVSKSIDNSAVKVHESGSIPTLLDFSAIRKLNIDPEYVAVSCLHQCSMRYSHVVTSETLKNFEDTMQHLSTKDSSVSSVLKSLQLSSADVANEMLLAKRLLQHVANQQLDSCVSSQYSSRSSNVCLLKFLLHMFIDDSHAAYEVISDLLCEAYKLLPADLNQKQDPLSVLKAGSSGSSSFMAATAADAIRLLHVASQLQLILNILELSFYEACCATFENHNRTQPKDKDSCADVFHSSKLRAQLYSFVDHHRYLLPLMSVTVRSAFLFSCLFDRPDIVQVLLSSDSLNLLDSEQREKYNQTLSFRMDTSAAVIASNDATLSVVEGDEGYKYLQKLTRDHCNKLLTPCKTGAFIIRPHETNTNQYFVSFKGTEEEGVKHAIIRREDNPNSTSEADKFVYQCGKIGPCTSMMILLTEISKILANPLLFDTVVQYDVSVLLPHVSLDVNHALWSTVLPPLLPSLLNSISVDHYDPARSGADDSDGDGSSSGGTASSDDNGSYSSEGEGEFAAETANNGGEDGVECEQEVEGDYVMLISSDTKNQTSGAAVGGGSISKKSSRKRLALEDAARKWNIPKSSSVMSSMIEKLVAFLSVREYLKQITLCTTASSPSVIDLLFTQELLRHADAAPTSDGHSRDSTCLLQKIHSKLCPSLTSQAESEFIASVSSPSEGSSSGANTKYVAICNLLLQTPIAHFLIKSEAIIQSLFMPPLPRLQHYVPTPYSYPEYDRAHEYFSGNYPNAPNPEGTLLAESLLKLAIKVMSTKYVKFPGYGNGYGGAEHIIENCLEIGEFSILLTKWRMLSMKYKTGEGSEGVDEGVTSGTGGVGGSFPKTGSAERLDTISVTSGKASGGGSIAGGLGKTLSSTSLTKLSSNIKNKITTQLHLPGSVGGSVGGHGNSSGGNTPVAGGSNKPAVDVIYQDTTQQIVDILFRVNRYLQIPASCTTAYAQTICSWLVQIGALHQVTKLADHAFALPTTYYKYIDPWEVRALHDYSLASERVRLGRNHYGVCTTMVNYNNNKAAAGGGAAAGDALAAGEISPAPASKPVSSNRSQTDLAGSGVTSGKMAPPNTATALVANILHFSHVFFENQLVSSGLVESKFKRKKEYRVAIHKLWELLSAEMYLVSLFSSALPQPEREVVHSSLAANPEAAANQVQTNYQSTLLKFMYRNALYSRLAFPHRYVPNIQVDIYSIKEVLSVSSKTTSGAVKVPLGPGSASATISSATLTPSTATHGSSVELFATIRLTRASAKRVDMSQLTSNKTVHLDGTVISGSHKAESSRNGGNTVNTTSTIYRRNTAHSTQTMNTITSISNSIDYTWREQAIFRHALPEGLLYPSLPRPNVCDPGVSSPGVIPAVNLPLYAPPNRVVIAVYERSFFSDHKLGEVEINLTELADKRVIRDWFPLVNSDKCISWLIYLQIKVKFQLMTVEMTTAPHSSSRSTSKEKGFYYTQKELGDDGASAGNNNNNNSADSRSSSVNSTEGSSRGGKKGGRGKKTSFLGQLDDFF